MIKATFKGAPTSAKPVPSNPQACKCGRCTRTGEQSDSSQASSDLG